MENFENSSAVEAREEQLQAQLDSVQHLLTSVLVLFLVVSGTLNLYFWRQFRNAKAELAVERPQISAMVAEYNRKDAPVVNEFVRRLSEFSRTHSDFEAILAGQGIRLPGNTSASAAPASATPAGGHKK